MTLKGSVVVVTGGTGTVGGGIVQRFLQERATVVAPLRSAASKPKLTDHLTASTATLHTPVADWNTEEGAAALAKFIKDQALTVDHVVSIAGGMAETADVADITRSSLHKAVDLKVLGHVLMAQHLMPLVRQAPTSSWTVVTGMLGEVVFMPGVALTAITNGGVYALVKALQFEQKEAPLRVNELRIASVIRRDAAKENPEFPGIPTAPVSKVGGVLAGIAAGSQRDEVVNVGLEDLQKVPDFA